MSSFTDKAQEQRQRRLAANRQKQVIQSLKGILDKETDSVSVKNLPKDLASKNDIESLVEAISEATLTSFVIFMHSSEQMERLIAKLDTITTGRVKDEDA